MGRPQYSSWAIHTCFSSVIARIFSVDPQELVTTKSVCNHSTVHEDNILKEEQEHSVDAECPTARLRGGATRKTVDSEIYLETQLDFFIPRNWDINKKRHGITSSINIRIWRLFYLSS